MKKTNPLLLWIIMWVLGMLLITIKNRIVAGSELDLGSILVTNVIIDIIVVPVALIGYFILKFIAGAVGSKDFFTGVNSLRNTFLVWLVFFVLVFLFPLFKK